MAEIKKQRITAIDVAKGIGILTVIMSHIIYEGNLQIILYAFHMPMFFMISGMFTKPEKYAKFWDFLKIKLQTLICPYVLFCILGIFVFIGRNILIGESVSAVVKSAVKSLGIIVWAPYSHYFGSINTPLWFVPCLFLTEIIYYFLSKIKNKPLFIILLVFLVILGWFTESKYCTVDFTFLPWNFSSALFSLGFFAIGNYSFDFLNKKILSFSLNSKRIIVLIAISLLSFCAMLPIAFLNGKISIGSRELKNGILLYATGIIGSLGIISISKVISNCKFLNFCGKNSFVIMASHVLISGIIGTFSTVLASKLNWEIIDLNVNTLPRSIIRFIIVTIFTLLFTLVYLKVVNKIKAKINDKKSKAA